MDLKALKKLSNKSFLSTKHFLSLAQSSDPKKDPILRQVLPSEEENIKDPMFQYDPLAEKKFSPLPKLIRRYQDRALILCTNKCFIHCRFCFRKRLWLKEKKIWFIKKTEFAKIAKFISNNPEISEVILSGGDPLCMKDENLLDIIKTLDTIPSVNIIRLASRALSAEPYKFTPAFVSKLRKSSNKIWFMSHFNHPRELSESAKIAISLLINAGIPILNQTVLLKGINNDSAILAKLFQTLASIKVRPHYLFHVDPVKGNTAFITGVDNALKIVADLRKKLSSICVPTFAIDLPSGGGKIALLPAMRKGQGKYSNYNGKIFKYF